MTYRDDNDALRAHNEALTADLVSAEEEVRALKEQVHGKALTHNHNPFYGAATRLHFEIECSPELDPEHIGSLLGQLRPRHDLGGLRRKNATTWTSLDAQGEGARHIEVSLLPSAGAQRVVIREYLSDTASSLFGVVVGGVAGAGFAVLLPATLLLGLARPLIPIACVLWFGGMYALTRFGYRRLVRRRRAELSELRALLSAELESSEDASGDQHHRRKRGLPKVRVPEEAQVDTESVPVVQESPLMRSQQEDPSMK